MARKILITLMIFVVIVCLSIGLVTRCTGGSLNGGSSGGNGSSGKESAEDTGEHENGDHEDKKGKDKGKDKDGSKDKELSIEDLYKASALSDQPVPDPEDFVGKAKIGSAGGKKGIHGSKWTPREKAPWICVIRAKDPAMRLRIAKAMKQAIKLDNVKYSGKKEKRITFYEEASKVDFDLPEVNAECYTSCTSVASVCLRAAGFSKKVAPKLVYSDSKSPKTNLRKHLKEIADDFGIFAYYETPDYTADSSKLEPGDILFSEHHVAVVIRSENKVDLDE